MKKHQLSRSRTVPLLLSLAAGITLLIGCGGSGSSTGATTTTGGTTGKNSFVQTNLVADTAGKAVVTDPNLVNPWGISFAPGGPFWISDNAKGVSTLYDGAGVIQPLVVTIPSASATPAKVTGQVYNGTGGFIIPGQGVSQFIFVNGDGIVSAWYAGNSAVTVNDRSASGASYDGLAMASNGSASFLYAANFNSGMIDVFDTSFTLVNSFTDTAVPSGFAPFNVQNIGGSLFVTFALQDPTKHRDVPGAGNGFVDVFNPSGTLKMRLVSNGVLNSPWGLAQAPATFGSFGNALLVGNLGDGKINAFNISTGAPLGTLNDSTGNPIVNPGLWAITFAAGVSGSPANALYFTAGPNSYGSGLFGTLTASP